MHAILSYRSNRPTHKQTHTQTKKTGAITIDRTARSVNIATSYKVSK